MVLEHAAVSLVHQSATVPEWIILKGKVLSQRVMAVPSLADLKRCIVSTGSHAQAVTVQILKALIERASENIYSRDVNEIERYFKAVELVLAARTSVNGSVSPLPGWTSSDEEATGSEANDQPTDLRGLFATSPTSDEEFSLHMWSSPSRSSPSSAYRHDHEDSSESSQGSYTSSLMASRKMSSNRSETSSGSDSSNYLSLGAYSAYQTTEKSQSMSMSIDYTSHQFSAAGWRAILPVHAPKPLYPWSKPCFIEPSPPLRISLDVFDTLSEATDSLIYTIIFPAVARPDAENVQMISRGLLKKVLQTGSIILPVAFLKTIAQDWKKASVIAPQEGMEWISFLASDLAANLEQELSSLSLQDERFWISRLRSMVTFIVELQSIADLAIPVAASVKAGLENLFACASLLPGKSETSLFRIGHISDIICQILADPTAQVLSTHSVTVLNTWLEFIYERTDQLVGCFLRDQISCNMLLPLAKMLTHIHLTENMRLFQRPNFLSLVTFVFDKLSSSVNSTTPYKKAFGVLLLLACFPSLGLAGALPVEVFVSFHAHGGAISPYMSFLESEMSVARGHRAEMRLHDALAVLMEAQAIEETLDLQTKQLMRYQDIVQ
ncbi:hypothetical protein BU17DRAFT_90567 [Hysterangium stoloniferum]|nr:hypothetical protein BU17DRAFT_90567 [Hysterangium stoloniferum]